MSNFSQRVCRKVREYYLIKISVTIEVKYSKIFSFLKKKCFVVFFCFVLLLVSHQSFLLSLCQWPHSTTDKRIQPKKSKEREREANRWTPSAKQRVRSSVTRLGDLMPFGQLFKACGINYFTLTAHIFRQFL